MRHRGETRSEAGDNQRQCPPESGPSRCRSPTSVRRDRSGTPRGRPCFAPISPQPGRLAGPSRDQRSRRPRREWRSRWITRPPSESTRAATSSARSQPRHRAQDTVSPQPTVGPTSAGIDERHVRRGQHEVPEQVLPGTSQRLQGSRGRVAQASGSLRTLARMNCGSRN
jgi:hypothetical protein